MICASRFGAGTHKIMIWLFSWRIGEVWKTLLKARAIENQAFVAGVNCVGEDDNGLTYSGDSMVADARGMEIGSTSPGNEAIIRVELDIEKLRQFRKKFPVLDDRDDFLFREK
mgnify:CR=1 FL=1